MDNSSGVVPCEIEGQTSNNHQVVLPLGLTPRDGGHQDTFTTLASTKTWFMENKGKVEELLELHGAVVFRGFPLRTPEDFDEVVSGGLGVQVFPYQAGNAPRHKVCTPLCLLLFSHSYLPRPFFSFYTMLHHKYL